MLPLALQPALTALLGSVVMAAKILLCERCVYAVCNAAARGAVVRSYGRQCASIDHAKLHASCCACTGQQGIDDRSAQASQA